ncbi:MAG: hypothetical protein QNJ34_00505 [Xenococcaceae cyanobacterium MO_188.B29]|nr:hypothetical protein [Xenococcaceae cyanobacterium MO_188.B29]
MSNNNFLQIIQQGFRVTVGATTSLVETIQDPQKRTEALSQIQTELEQKTQEWSQKGEVTEQEARRIIDNLISQRGWQKKTNTANSNNQYSSSSNSSENSVQSDLEELTEQIIALRKDLENLQQSSD